MNLSSLGWIYGVLEMKLQGWSWSMPQSLWVHISTVFHRSSLLAGKEISVGCLYSKSASLLPASPMWKFLAWTHPVHSTLQEYHTLKQIICNSPISENSFLYIQFFMSSWMSSYFLCTFCYNQTLCCSHFSNFHLWSSFGWWLHTFDTAHYCSFLMVCSFKGHFIISWHNEMLQTYFYLLPKF